MRPRRACTKRRARTATPPTDPTDRPGMRFAFLIHPISEQTKDLMDAGQRWPAAEDLGPGRPAPVLCRGPCCLRGPFPADAGRAAQGSAGRRHVRRAGLVDRCPGRRAPLRDPDGCAVDPGRPRPGARAHGAGRHGCHRLGGADRRARLDDRHHRQPRRVPGRAPPDRRDDGQQPDGLRDPAEPRALLRVPGDRPGRRGDRGRGDPGQHRDGRGRAAGTPVPSAGAGGTGGLHRGRSTGPSGWARGWRWISPGPWPRPRSW